MLNLSGCLLYLHCIFSLSVFVYFLWLRYFARLFKRSCLFFYIYLVSSLCSSVTMYCSSLSIILSVCASAFVSFIFLRECICHYVPLSVFSSVLFILSLRVCVCLFVSLPFHVLPCISLTLLISVSLPNPSSLVIPESTFYSSSLLSISHSLFLSLSFSLPSPLHPSFSYFSSSFSFSQTLMMDSVE